MRGRAEAIRIFMHATHTSFEDHRVTSVDEWRRLKPDLPFGSLPIYEEEDLYVCESHAILRYLGKTLTRGIQDDLHCAELDAIHDAIAETQENLWRFNWEENYYDHLERYAKETLYPRLKNLENSFRRKRIVSLKWLGAEFSHVDCVAFCFLDEIDAFFPRVLADFVVLGELHTRVASLPSVSDYLKSASRPIVFGMGIMGPKVDPRMPIHPGSDFPNPWTRPIDLAATLLNQCRLT